MLRLSLGTFHQTLLLKARKTSLISNILKRAAAHAHCTNLKMNKVYFRNATGSQELYINFRYKDEKLRVDREFNFCRNLNENVDIALVRMRNNIEKELNKRSKKSKKKSAAQQAQEQPDVKNIVPNEVQVEFVRSGCDDKITDITFAEILSNDFNILKLRVLDNIFDLELNQPWVKNLVLPTSTLAGFIVYPSKIEMQFAQREHSRGAWFKAKIPPSGDLQKVSDWQHCSDSFFYTTTNDDIGHYLKFVLTPGNSDGQLGPSVENITKNPVQAGPGECPFQLRNSFTNSYLSNDSFRVVSYNILADLYSDSDYARTNLFPYCPPYALQMDYRKQLFIKEIVGYKADIVCLQEVDLKIFDLDLKIVLEDQHLGYKGLIAQKGTCGEGVAVFYRKDRFELINSREINIGENIRSLPEFAELWQKISNNEKLVERICDRSTTLQVILLKSKENYRYVLVANTHLYFHPDADHIRLLQMGFAMLYIQYVYEIYVKELRLNNEKDLNIIFCGDFNSVPECGIYKLMTEQFVDEHFVDWSSNLEQSVKNVTLSQPFEMQSACGTPSYTNFTHAFAACLDYIFYQSDRMEVQQVVPLPTDDDLRAHIAIPSVVFPSDHVALVADLRFKALNK